MLYRKHRLSRDPIEPTSQNGGFVTPVPPRSLSWNSQGYDIFGAGSAIADMLSAVPRPTSPHSNLSNPNPQRPMVLRPDPEIKISTSSSTSSPIFGLPFLPKRSATEQFVPLPAISTVFCASNRHIFCPQPLETQPSDVDQGQTQGGQAWGKRAPGWHQSSVPLGMSDLQTQTRTLCPVKYLLQSRSI